MDWIKQIIECKKGNWESPGSLGQKIKKIRRGDDEEKKYTLCYEYPNEIAVVSQYELLKRKALQAEIENLQLKINDLENENKGD